MKVFDHNNALFSKSQTLTSESPERIESKNAPSRQESFSSIAKFAVTKLKGVPEKNPMAKIKDEKSFSKITEKTSSFKEHKPKFFVCDSEATDEKSPEEFLGIKCMSPSESQLSFGEKQDVVMTMRHQEKIIGNLQKSIGTWRDIKLCSMDSGLEKKNLPTVSTLCSTQNLDTLQ